MTAQLMARRESAPASVPVSSTIAPAPAAPTVSASPQISVSENGYVHGIDGLLGQVATALMRSAKSELLPAVRRDQALQQAVGRAIGRELAKPLWVIAGATVVYVGYKMLRASR